MIDKAAKYFLKKSRRSLTEVLSPARSTLLKSTSYTIVTRNESFWLWLYERRVLNICDHIRKTQKSATVLNEKGTRKVLTEPNISTKEYINHVYQLKVYKVYIYVILDIKIRFTSGESDLY